jgi:predicted peptidase
MKIRIRVPSVSIESLLVAAIAALLVVLSWPMIEAWLNRPRPGVQVCRQEDNEGYTNFLLYLPREYDPSRKWPLLVYLHGSAERGDDAGVVRHLGPPHQIELGNDLPFIVVSPQCPDGSRWIPEKVVKLIEHVGRRFAVDADRVYLTGYSMGGFGTWETACFDPERFAAIVPVAGGGDVAQAKRLVNLPIWAFHGAKDEVVPPEASRKMVDAVRKCGGHVDFTMLPGCGHGICDPTYRDRRLSDWLLAQRRHSSKENDRK